MSGKKVLSFTASLVLLAVCSASAFAGWEVTVLHPPGATSSRADAVSGGQQVGQVNFATGGYYYPHAYLWSGTAESWVDLHPEGAYQSYCSGMSDGRQVGTTHIDGRYRASLWSGTAESWVSLHPAAANSSRAIACSGGQQVGYAYFSSARAALWSGTAASYVDLHPAGAYMSFATGVFGGQQVGFTRAHDYASSAGMWSGTAESWVDFHPAGSYESVVNGICDEWQAGTVYFGETPHAVLWRGTAESLVDLHGLLGAGYVDSAALDVEVVGDDIWIAGFARDPVTHTVEAILWHNVIPEPSSLLALGGGLLALGGLIRRRR